MRTDCAARPRQSASQLQIIGRDGARSVGPADLLLRTRPTIIIKCTYLCICEAPQWSRVLGELRAGSSSHSSVSVVDNRPESTTERFRIITASKEPRRVPEWMREIRKTNWTRMMNHILMKRLGLAGEEKRIAGPIELELDPARSRFQYCRRERERERLKIMSTRRDSHAQLYIIGISLCRSGQFEITSTGYDCKPIGYGRIQI